MPPQPLSPYAVSKLAGEHLMRVFAQLYGIETVSLRYFNVFGPRQDPEERVRRRRSRSFITAALRGRAARSSSATASRRATSASSTTRSRPTCSRPPRRASSRGEVVNIACGERTSLNQLLAVHRRARGRRRVEAEYRPARAGDVRDSLADVSAARALLGYEPAVDVREGLRRTFLAFAPAKTS